jgi:protocatechuate 3,4-dioxygenase beta subunit
MTSAATFHSRLTRTAVLAAALATLAACSDSSSPPKDVTPATITASSTDTLHATVGTAVNTLLTVTVNNKAGVPIDSALVTFAVVTGGGQVSTANAVTNTAGQASTTWTLGKTAGVQTMTATSGSVSTTFTAIAAGATAATATKLAGDGQTAAAGAAVAIAPSVKVTDTFGNPIAGVLVTFNVASGGGSTTGALVNTDATGVATVGSWKLGTNAGPNTLIATAGSLAAVTFSATASAGAVTQLAFTNTAPALAVGQTFTLTTQAKDANNNIVTNAAVAFSSSNSGVVTVGASTGLVTAVASGTATITATSGTITAQQTISVTGHPSTTVVGAAMMTSAITGMAVAGNTAYVARSTANAVGIVDLPSATLTSSVNLGASPVDVAANASGTVIAAATTGPSRIWFINGSTAVRTDSMELPAKPLRMAMTSTGSKLYVDLDNFSVQVIDVASRTVTATLPIAGTVTTMKIGVGDSLLYIGTKFGTIYEVSIATNTVRRQFNPSSATVDLAISPDGKTLYAADGSATIDVIQLATGGLANQTYDFSGNVTALAIPRDGSQLWAGYLGGGAIVPIVSGSFGIWAPIALSGVQPFAIVFNSIGSLVAIADVSTNQIIVLK